jgi:PAS domain S-box-containing protein
MSKSVKSDLLTIAEKEKAKHEAELIILNKQLSHQIERRKQSDLALKEGNDKYSKAFKSSPYSITIKTAEEGKFIDVNDAFTAIFGFTREEALTNSSIELDKWVNIEDRKWVMSTLLSGNDVEGKEFLFKKKSGEIITGLFSAKTINIKNEPCIISNISDITDLKKTEKTLQNIIDNNPMAIQILDTEGFTLKVNQAFLMLYGSIPPLDYSMFNDMQLNDKGFGNLIDHIKNAEVVHFPDMPFNPHDSVPSMPDVPVWVRTIVFPLVDGKGKPEKFVFLHENITEKKQAGEALKESEIKYRGLVENSPDAIIIYQDGEIVFANKECLRLIGAERKEDLKKKSLIEFVHPDFHGFAIERMKKLQNEGTLLPIAEERFVRLDGEEIDVEVIGMSIRFENKPAVQLIIRNITERKQTELALKLKIDEIESINKKLSETNVELILAKEKAEESDRLKSAFLTNMSHEIRTPMNGILGFAELLKEPNLTIDEQQEYIQTMQISGARMLNTINSIVDISKIESGLIGIDIKETNLNEKIEFTYKFFKQEVVIKGLAFLFKNGLPTNEAIIKTDNEKVYGILTNLVRNAIKFTRDGSIEFGYEKKGEYLEFFVKDTGTGIPQKQQQLIFERFRQGSEAHNRGYEGSGLGLSISKSYVEMLGGRIWVESEEGLGSTFYFTIPYNPVSEEKATIENAASAEHKEVQLNNLKILIVEDDEISYSLLSRTIQKISKEVLHAITGVEAIEACRYNPDLDLVLMDIRMPQMNGLEATQQIRLFNKDVIIIAQTAYAFAGDSEKAIEAGCNDYISKPINKTSLYDLIKKYVKK